MLIFENESKRMSELTVGKTEKYKKRVSKFVRVFCKRLQPLTVIFKDKASDKIFKSVISFKNHTINCAFHSLFIRFRQNILTTFSVDGVEHNHIELITKYVVLVKSPFVTEQIVSHLSKESEGNIQYAVINFLPLQNTTLDLEMAQIKISNSECKRNWQAEKCFHKLYPKYLPIKVNASASDSYLRTEVDTKAPMCWLDIQAWYIRQKSLENTISSGILKSNSDTEMTCSNTSNRPLDLNKRWRKKKIRRLTSAATEYIENISNMHEASSIELVIQMMPEISSFQYILRTELLIDCLKFFCVPFEVAKVEIKCVSTLSEHFAGDIEIDKSGSCLVKVEGPASILLKKKELAVWDTIGHIIGINPRRIALLETD